MGRHKTVAALLLLAALVSPEAARTQAIDPVDDSCPILSPTTQHDGAALQNFATNPSPDTGGVVWDPTSSSLKLEVEGGEFAAANFTISSTLISVAAADFDEDGWPDLVGCYQGSRNVRFFKNHTGDYDPAYFGEESAWDESVGRYEPAPNWNDPSYVRRPKFLNRTDIWRHDQSDSESRNAAMAAGDFNNDGHADFVVFKHDFAGSYNNIHPIQFQSLFAGRGDGTFAPPDEDFVSTTGLARVSAWPHNNLVVADYNGDGWDDILWGAGSLAMSGADGSRDGTVQVLLNQQCVGALCTPNFSVVTLMGGTTATDIDFADHSGSYVAQGVTAIAYGLFDDDEFPDLIIASLTTRDPMRLYPGKAKFNGLGLSQSSSFDPDDASQYIEVAHPGYATLLLSGDFTGDGKRDLIHGTDGFTGSNLIGADTTFYKNDANADGDGDPFDDGPTTKLTSRGDVLNGQTINDWDLGVVFNYDRDPHGFNDFLIADGNNSAKYYVFANRAGVEYEECGTVASGALDLGALATTEMVIAGVRLSPSVTVPGGTWNDHDPVTFYAANANPPVWYEASDCGDGTGDLCVTFPSSSTGRDVRWKAVLCSSDSRTETPEIAGVEINFVYKATEEHFRAGPVVEAGHVYLGGFKNPGGRGRFYALSAASGATVWEFSSRLDGMADAARKLYSTTADGVTRLDWDVSNSVVLEPVLGAASSAQASAVIAWQRSARFGLSPLTKLGAIENSTGAVVGAPGRPVYYDLLAAAEQAKVDAFAAAHANRQELVLFGSKDGALHAVRTFPDDPSHPQNGLEAWAFIPSTVAAGMVADYTAYLASAAEPSSYPDGSPTVADVMMESPSCGTSPCYRTVALIASGNGGRSVTALDVTATVDPSDPTVVSGPVPLWNYTPSGAGLALSKPVIARVNVGTSGVALERYYAVFASSRDTTNPALGRRVVALDIRTGTVAWQFEAKCAVTSDILAYESDDGGEPAGPHEIDGFVDFLMFADNCGYVYKLRANAAVGDWNLAGSATDAIGLVGADGGTETGHVIDTDGDGTAESKVMAFFSTKDTAGALTEERPIVGTLGAAPFGDRLLLYFGTGGFEDLDSTLRNEFYVLYADTGAIKTKVVGRTAAGTDCSLARTESCEKFYGGVLLTSDFVMFTRTLDPSLSSATCDLGSSTVTGLSAGGEAVSFNAVVSSGAIVAPLYGGEGAVYTTNLDGEVVQIGTPSAPGESATQASSGLGIDGGGGGGGGGGGAGGLQWLAQRSWVQVQ